MSQIPTAKLLNDQDRVTLHQCVRLEMRRLPRNGTGPGCRPGIYPIYQCSETASERIFGCLRLDLGERELARFFPGVSLCRSDEPDNGVAQVAAIAAGLVA